MMSFFESGASRSSPAVFRAGRPARAARLALAALLAVLVSASCVETTPAGPSVPLIPGDSIAAVVVDSPYRLFSACDDFWKSSQLEQLVGTGLEDLLSQAIPNAGRAAEVLDFARPWALAVLPTEQPKKPSAAIFIPYRSDPEDFLGALLGSGSLKVVAKAKGYVVLAEGEYARAFPAKKALDLKALGRYPAGSIKLWGDTDALLALAKDEFSPIEDSLRGFVTDPEAGEEPGASVLGDGGKMLKLLGDAAMDLLGQLKAADAALVPSAQGFAIRVGATADAGSELRKGISKLGASGSALDWASQVDADAFYGLSWAIDPTVANDMTTRLLKPFLEALGLDKAAIDGVFAYQKKWARVAGKRGAMSFDLDLDADAFSRASGIDSEDYEAVARLVKDMMSFDVDAVMEVKKESSYRELMRAYTSDPDLRAFMKAYGELLGVEISFTGGDATDGSFSYGELGFSIKVTDPTKLGASSAFSGDEREAMDAVMAAVSSMIQMRWTVSGGRCFVTTGDVEGLKELAGRKAAERSLVDEPSFSAFSASIPKKPVVILSMSMRKLMGMIGDVASAVAPSANQLAGLQDLGNWYGYMSVVSSSTLEIGYLIPAADIGAIARFVIMMSANAGAGGDA